MTRTSLSVALVNPPNINNTGLKDENGTPPLGLAYLAASLRKNGYTADLFDLADMSINEASEILLKYQKGYNLFGFTSYTKSFPSAVSLARDLKKNDGSCITLFGGPHVSPLSYEVLNEHSEIDFVIQNEGEIAIVELCNEITSINPKFCNVSNLVYREDDKNGDRVIRNSINQTKFPPLDSLPFPVRDYKIEPSRVVIKNTIKNNNSRIEFFSSSRGCPKRCSFCSIVVMAPNYTFRTVENMMLEIKEVYNRLPFGHIAFLDPNFFAHYKRALDFSIALHNWNPDITWSGTATADTICKNIDVIEKISDLNCISLEIGLESGSDTVLKRFNKKTNVQQNIQAVSELRKYNIAIDLDFVMYDPETEIENLKENWEFLSTTDLIDYYPSDHWFNALKIYPGTPDSTKYGLATQEIFGYKSVVPPFKDKRVNIIYKLMISYYQNCQIDVDNLDSICNNAIFYTSNYKNGSHNCINTILKLSHTFLRLLPANFFYECINGEGLELSFYLHQLEKYKKMFFTIKSLVSKIERGDEFDEILSLKTLIEIVSTGLIEIYINVENENKCWIVNFGDLSYYHFENFPSIRLSKEGNKTLSYFETEEDNTLLKNSLSTSEFNLFNNILLPTKRKAKLSSLYAK
ncbi:B12-binding domain-containing radical SAM protein [Spirosoma radiotolerans]|uniref:Uncharacterized protein n=1 Tax=Spirosoma radiotolerans TaxID=1379870 RepID=A0A0E3ZXI8_9BACT|nr:radical SAM protein [Spirosoma radiotolerans]AKD56953.1 hypothetical protein SD10_20650 [Spirosoma radiotolerans]